MIEEATRTTENNHQVHDPLVKIQTLADRWNISYTGVLWRLKVRQIPRLVDDFGKAAVRESDLAGVDWSQPVPHATTPKKIGRLPQTSDNGTSAEAAKREATPPRDVAIVPPIVGDVAVTDVDQAKVRRLLLALRMIADLTEGAESPDGFAVSAVARYALACEQQVTP